jgi:hypothetical protein
MKAALRSCCAARHQARLAQADAMPRLDDALTELD